MSIEIGKKYISKDGGVVVVENIKNNYYNDTKTSAAICVWFWDIEGDIHVLTDNDFIEQHRPYEVIYEYQYLFKLKDSKLWNGVTSYHKDIQECIDSELEEARDKFEYQRLDFTKRVRK